MPFQKQVGSLPQSGIEGDLYSLNPLVATAKQAGADVTVGRFGWIAAADDTVKNTGTGKPNGVIKRDNTGAITDFNAEASMLIQSGFNATLVIKGEIWVRTLTDATKGQKAFAVLADGTIKTGAAGASTSSGTLQYTIETDFVVLTAAAAGELIAISNWRN
jgi:hypothetical protein